MSISVSAFINSEGVSEKKDGKIEITKISEGAFKIDYSCLKAESLPTILINVYGKDSKYDLYDVTNYSCMVDIKQLKKKIEGDFKILGGDKYFLSDLPFKVDVLCL